MPACLKCGSKQVVDGTFVAADGGAAVFRPDLRPRLSWWSLTFSSGTQLANEAFACRECGLVWSSTPPEKLRKYIERRCHEPEA